MPTRLNIYGQAISTTKKRPCIVATTTNIVLSGASTPTSIDGVNIGVDDRILVWQQNSPQDNGIYRLETSQLLSRDYDFNISDDLYAGIEVLVLSGLTYSGKTFYLTTLGDLTIGSSSLTFDILAGQNGTSGTSGGTGSSGASGSSGSSGSSGTSGTEGTSGSSGSSGTEGTSGTSGSSGTSGTEGTSGSSGSSGTSGSSGSSGTSGTEGTSGSSGTSGTEGTSGSSGTSGTAGTSGSAGTSGIDGQSNAIFPYNARTNITSGNPGTSNIIWNNVNQTLATQIGISHLDGDNDDIDIFLSIILSGSTIIIQDSINSNNYQRWIFGVGVEVSPNDYWEFPATYVDGGYSFSGNQSVLLIIAQTPSGTSGVSGSSGTSGTSGVSGSSGTSATSGSSGTSATSGSSGTSGGTGSSGASGSSGSSGTSGSSGSSGSSGTSGSSGSSGTSGTSPASQISGSGTVNYIPKFTGTTNLGNSIIFDNGSNVGIGTASPTARLQVKGSGNSTGEAFKIENSIDTNLLTVLDNGSMTLNTPLSVANGGTNTSTAFTAGSIVFAGASGTYAQDNTNLFWDNTNKRLGIGTNTGTNTLTIKAPSASFRVESTTGTNFTDFRIVNTGGTLFNAISRSTGGVIGVDGNYEALLFYSGAHQNNMLIGTGGHIRFLTSNNNGTSYPERMRITSDGNVGIGTTTIESSPNYTSVNINGTTGSEMYFKANNTSVGFLYANNGSFNIGSITNVAFDILTNSTTKMRITSTGNVGIGTTSPNIGGVNRALTLNAATSTNASYELSVNNILQGSLYTNISDASVRLANFNSGDLVFLTGAGSIERMRIASTGAATFSSTVTCTTLTETSSIKIKENVKTLDNPLDIIKRLRGVEYNRIGETYNEIGVIAEEVNDVLPQVVNKDEEGNPTSVSYGRLTALLIEVVKKQDEQIQNLTKRIEELEK